MSNIKYTEVNYHINSELVEKLNDLQAISYEIIYPGIAIVKSNKPTKEVK